MHFTPLSDEELLPDGTYNYLVVKSDDKVSKSGNEYISLMLKITTNEGKEHIVFTNLALIKLLKHFCDVNNMQDLYKSGNVPASQCSGRSGGRILIGTEPEKPNPDGGVYRAKNIVKDYVIEPKDSLTMPLSSKEDFTNDEIPF